MHLMTDPHTLSSVIYASPQRHDPWAPITLGGWGAKTFSFDGDTRGYSGELVRSDPVSNSTPFVLSTGGWEDDADIHHAAELHTKDMEERQRKILGDACMVSAAAPPSLQSLGAKLNTMSWRRGTLLRCPRLGAALRAIGVHVLTVLAACRTDTRRALCAWRRWIPPTSHSSRVTATTRFSSPPLRLTGRQRPPLPCGPRWSSCLRVHLPCVCMSVGGIFSPPLKLARVANVTVLSPPTSPPLL